MSRKYYNNGRKSGARGLGIVLALLMFGTMLTGIITKGFTDWNPYGWFNEDCKHTYENGICVDCGAEEATEENTENVEE